MHAEPFHRLRAAIPPALVFALLALPAAAQINQDPAGMGLDHPALIRALDQKAFERGKAIYQSMCFACHGIDGTRPPNPQARSFTTAELVNGGDPYNIWKTITFGLNAMPSQAWLTPAQRYDVAHYIREAFLKEKNPTQYVEVTDAYLASLPRPAKQAPENSKQGATGKGEVPTRDFGPAFASQLKGLATAALSVRLDDRMAIAYDTHRLSTVGVWRGGFLHLENTKEYQQRGEDQPTPDGEPITALSTWFWGFGGSLDYWTDDVGVRAPLERDRLDYRGHYLHGNRVVLSYAIDGRGVLEMPESQVAEDFVALSQTLRIEPGENELVLCVGRAAAPDGASLIDRGGAAPAEQRADASSVIAQVNDEHGFTLTAVVGQVQGLSWRFDDKGRLVLHISPASIPRSFRVIRTAGTRPEEVVRFATYIQYVDEHLGVSDLSTMTAGAESHWPDVLETAGTLGTPDNDKLDGAYVLDTLTLPPNNPWNAWLRTSAIAFFDDGRAAVATYTGDIWIVSGIDHDLAHLRWKRYAAGLFEPMGLRVIDGLVYATCRDRIVRLHDLNGDGEADFYESFYADRDVSAFFHAFNFDLQRDRAGNLYYVKAGEYTDHALPGAVVRVSPDGRSSEVIATGFRTPNGMGTLPDGRLTVSDNQGDWMPASKISLIHKGGFYGYVPTHTGGDIFGNHWSPDGGRIDPSAVKPPADFDRPMVWMPQDVDSSSGGQVWAGDIRWGPLSGKLIHTSFGKGWAYTVLLDELDDGRMQGAVVTLPFDFAAGIQRARVNPADGQVYFTGLSGWQGPSGGADGAVQRLRWVGKAARLIEGWRALSDGVELRFNFGLDDSAATPGAFQVERWNYLWSQAYGSEHYSIEKPGEVGHDHVEVNAVQLGSDRRGVRLRLSPWGPADQVRLRMRLRGSDGRLFVREVHLTVLAVHPRR